MPIIYSTRSLLLFFFFFLDAATASLSSLVHKKFNMELVTKETPPQSKKMILSAAEQPTQKG
ncbi:hypothetical protein V6Z12_A09G244300 [Gossypium hirsutum]